VLVACAAAAFLGLAGGLVLSRRTTPGASSIDVRFLQDMRWHHDQGVGMALSLLGRADTSPAVHQRAREIIADQQLENGAMVELLHSFRAAEANETDVAMEWMPIMPKTTPNSMPGMAQPDDLTRLAELRGTDADKLFLTLMIAHHQGGIHMADYAAAHAHVQRVRDIATGIVTSQQGEINDLTQLLAQLGAK
jgi:uncharacterized protein (DUF305 family)